jgi:hypothetical protein
MLRIASIFSLLAALALLGAAGTWWRVVHADETDPGAKRLRVAAAVTALAFWLLSVALFARLFERFD